MFPAIRIRFLSATAMSDPSTNRIRILFGVLFIFALILVGKLYLEQIVRNEEYAVKADRQYVTPQGALFDRGAIFFEDKAGRRISAATLEPGFTLVLNPKKLIDAEAAYEALSPLVELDREDFFKKAEKSDDPHEELAQKLSTETADAISALGIPGVELEKERWRFYPGGERAAHALGFVGFNGNELVGQYGLERYYERTLSRNAQNMHVNFFAEIFGSLNEVAEIEEGEGAGDIVTTIEPTVEGVLEQTLAQIAEEWSSKSVGGIIMNPATGEIIAMAAYPTFDPNNFASVENLGVFKNPLVENVYEMGSIMKPLTMAAGLDARVVTPETTYNDTGSLTLDGRTISNYDGRGRGVVPMYNVLGESLNTGVAFVVGELGNKRFADYLRAFGLGRETGIDLPGEIAGLLDPLDSPRDIEYATASYGQGIAVTPIEMIRALAVLANGGMLVDPHLVKEIEYDLGITKTKTFASNERVLSEEASETITKMLVKVVDEFLLGGTVKLERYSVAAKTGTAQISNKAGKGYYDDRYLHSFFGYFPAYDPKFIIFLYNEEPKNVEFASQTLTHPFMELTEFLINYYEIPPDR